ncbi:MAG: hypothetical protein ACSHXF_06730 [Aquaticitalea sp.]
MTLSELHLKIQNAPELDFGTVLSDCIELFKKFWVQGLLTIVIIAVATIPIALVSQVILELFGVFTPTIVRMEDFNLENFSALYGFNALYNFPFAIITVSIQIAVLAGFYRIVKTKDVDKIQSSDDYFYFFKKEYFGKILLLGLVHSLISTVSQFMCFIPYIYVFVPLMYISVMFAFNSEKSMEEILRASFMLGNKKWLLSFGTLIVALILGMLGLIACCIGVLVTIPFVYLPCYVIYKNVVGFEDMSELHQIGQPQVF